LLETDPAKVLVRVADARTAICDRLRELLPLPSCEEHLTLKGALRFLDILEKEMLEARDAA
jgi:hypothetical protein